jgi:hypothetical protein
VIKDEFQPRLAAIPVITDILSRPGKHVLLLLFGRAHFSFVSLLGRLESRFAPLSCYLFLRLCLCQSTVDLAINLLPFCQGRRGFVRLTLYCSAGRLAFAFCCIPSDLCCCQPLLTPPFDDAPFFVAATQIQLFEFPTQVGHRRLGVESTCLKLCNDFFALLFDIPFNVVDATPGTKVAIGLHTHHCLGTIHSHRELKWHLLDAG